jgi:DNA-binding transcriptional regulator LsrR (DeoR family)/DNA-binding XRE family transcriptional regulator
MLNALDIKALGERIHKFQKERHLSQEKLAGEVEVDTGTVGRWIRGEIAPSLRNLCSLAQTLNVSLDSLVFSTSDDRTKSMSIDYEWEVGEKKESRPIISLMRQPRDEMEKMALRIAQLLFQGWKRTEIMQQFNIQEEEMLWRYVNRIASGDMLRAEAEYVPLNTELAKELRKKFNLKTCVVVELKNVDLGPLETVIMGAVGAKIVTKFTNESQVRLNVGFSGGFSCARVIVSLMQTEMPLNLDVVPIAVQQVENIVALDANTLIGMLGFFTIGTNLRVYRLPYVSNAQLEQNKSYEPYDITRRMIEKGKKVDLAFLGFGDDTNFFLHRMIHPLSRNEIFCQKTLFQIKQMGCIGDILYTLVAEDGPIPELQDCCDQMVCSIGLEGLQSLSSGHAHVIAVSSGQRKAPVARLALSQKYINGLIIDSELAQAILE